MTVLLLAIIFIGSLELFTRYRAAERWRAKVALHTMLAETARRWEALVLGYTQPATELEHRVARMGSVELRRAIWHLYRESLGYRHDATTSRQFAYYEAHNLQLVELDAPSLRTQQVITHIPLADAPRQVRRHRAADAAAQRTATPTPESGWSAVRIENQVVRPTTDPVGEGAKKIPVTWNR